MAKKAHNLLNIIQAVDGLSNLAELNMKQSSEWKDPKKIQENTDKIREIFRTLTAYLDHLYRKEKTEITNPKMQKGLQAIMQLAGEAVDKVSRFTQLIHAPQFTENVIPEFKQLQNFYLSKFFSKLKGPSKKPVLIDNEEASFDEEKQALKDLESVQKDTDYELFYISQENGKPFFSSNLLRHMSMVASFDENLISNDPENLLSAITISNDRNFHQSAQQILQEGEGIMQKFYKEASPYKEHPMILSLFKALMALMLAANPKNLSHNTEGKTSYDYFLDFTYFLRETIVLEISLQWRKSNAVQLTPFKTASLQLIDFLINSFFFRLGAYQDVIIFFERLSEKYLSSASSLWEKLAKIDTDLRQVLKEYPNGPLMKTMKIFKQGKETQGFDPLAQENLPYQLFMLQNQEINTTILHLACPIHQDFIDRARIVEEFKAYLRTMEGKKHLYIDLQNRMSWKDKQRCLALEGLSKEAEFLSVFKYMALPKNSDFYFQQEQYTNLTQAEAFCEECYQQLKEEHNAGFYFQHQTISLSTMKNLIKFIHYHFFNQNEILSRKERLDFIELLYFFIVLYTVEIEKPEVINFTCKDGVDIGATMEAVFYGLSRLLGSSKPWQEEDKRFFIFSLFGPAFLIRNRSVSTLYFQRALSVLSYFDEVMQEKRETILKALAELLPEIHLDKMKVSNVA